MRRCVRSVRWTADPARCSTRELAVGSDGTLLMILGAEIEHDWVNRLPEAERLPLLADAPPFEPNTAPVFHEVGYLAELCRQRPGALVTDNPSGRFGARGRLARELLAEPPWDDYYGPGSPLDRLCRLGGRVLRLGADLDTATVLHYAEYLADVPDKRRVRRHYRCRGSHGPETRAVECLDDSHGIVDWPGEDYFATILRDYLATGRAKQGTVGGAASELIEARDLVEFGATWMTTRFQALQPPFALSCLPGWLVATRLARDPRGPRVPRPAASQLPLARLEAYDGWALRGAAWMRFLLGVIVGALLTVGVAYVADSRADPLQGGRMVNWTVVGEKVKTLTADLREMWGEFTKQITGPP